MVVVEDGKFSIRAKDDTDGHVQEVGHADSGGVEVIFACGLMYGLKAIKLLVIHTTEVFPVLALVETTKSPFDNLCLVLNFLQRRPLIANLIVIYLQKACLELFVVHY
ncbi:hypothetical protein MPH_07862 [Macrophomina phaseolina MS6]|uniref:Uncharacterized protein n=1 Tax=Macrophomina phaseolina (strain MS6) TaxID=1126212 RepID=K2RQC1_MACPH|nr:hypothetical protein MPH_07862 [Macrophomina phaseolina MS6]